MEVVMSEWDYEYDNYGNGHFREWWELLKNGEPVSEFRDWDTIKEVLDKLNGYDEVVAQRDALLEACKNFFAWLDFENMNPEEDELYHLDQMRSAIAKAEGNDD